MVRNNRYVMRADIKDLVIIFENMESATIPMDEVGRLYIKGLEEILFVDRENDNVDQGYQANFVFIARMKKDILQAIPVDMWGSESRINLYDRINEHQDISHIIFKYEDGDSLTLNVWKGSDNYMNTEMKVAEGEDGMVAIQIGELE